MNKCVQQKHYWNSTILDIARSVSGTCYQHTPSCTFSRCWLKSSQPLKSWWASRRHQRSRIRDLDQELFDSVLTSHKRKRQERVSELDDRATKWQKLTEMARRNPIQADLPSRCPSGPVALQVRLYLLLHRH